MAEWIDREVQVLISGAGPTGLTLACELRRWGVDCLLVDEKHDTTPVRESRALGIQAATMDVFRRMGVADQMRDEGLPAHGVGVYRGGKKLVDVRFTLSPDETRFPYILVLPQGRTERIVLDRLEELGGEVEWYTRLASFKADVDGATVELKTDDGRSNFVRTRWLIGCDGARSAVRHGLGLAFAGDEYPERYLLADAEVAWNQPTDEGTVALTSEGVFVALPLPEKGLWRLIDAGGRSNAQTPEEIAARFAVLLGPISGLGGVLGETVWTSAFTIHRRVVDRYRAGRVFVAGDAAHLHSPAGGQGMNTGVQDAANLAWKLAMVLRGEAPESILESYDPERRPVGERVLRGTDRAMSMIGLRNPIARALRDATLAGAGRIEAFRRKLSREVAELTVAYPNSPIVAESRTGWVMAAAREGATGFNASEAFRRGPRPGERMPDVLLTQSDPTTGLPQRLSDVVFPEHAPPGHVLLVFQGTQPESGAYRVDFLAEEFIPPHLADRIRPILVEPHKPIEVSAGWRGERLADPADALHRRFGAQGACLFLIRPDGFIGFRARPLEPLAFREYCKRLFL
ncbi:FAD-dependent monooxygenase [Paludisphaera rhizosphaerae]|uniref:FAD-dependent monooxygenase n=1 Tax=Paludisphaera rhizosphaerae TaxID=2711216 RepID=UPI0013EB25F0|nr:FAD-dependent monooxygenase [Paludisphaera rhizosphaerae]